MRKGRLEGREKAVCIARAIGNKKGKDIVVLDIRKMPSVTDYFVLCTGTSSRHAKALAEAVRDEVGMHCQGTSRIERDQEYSWVLIDCGDVVCHVFRQETRTFYDLERLWGDAPRVRFTTARRSLLD